MDMATVEDGIAKGHDAKVKLLRELAAEIELSEQNKAVKLKPSQNLNETVKVKPVRVHNIKETDDDEDIVSVFIKCLRALPITSHHEM